MCPSGCGGKIKPQGMLDDFFHCEFCTFKISEKRYNEIVASKKEMITVTDNLSLLNNMGHKKVSEDYSDEIERL